MVARTGLFVAPLPGATPAGTSPTDGRLVLGALFGTTGGCIVGGLITQSATAMQVTIGQSVWRIPDPTNSAGVYLSPADPATVTFAAGPASGSRIDVLWVKQDNYEAGDADSRVVYGITAGTASSSPVAPAIPAGTMSLAQITVPTGASNAAACVVVSAYPGQGIVPPPVGAGSPGQLPTTGQYVGQRGYVQPTGEEYRWSGTQWQLWSSGWKTYTPTLTNVTVGNGTFQLAQYRYVDGNVYVSVDFWLGSTSAIGIAPIVSLPVPAVDTYGIFTAQISIGGNGYDCYPHHNAGAITLLTRQVSGTVLRTNSVTSTVPATWAAGDKFEIHGLYRVYT